MNNRDLPVPGRHVPLHEQSVGQLFATAARLSGSMWVRLLNERLGIGWTAFNVLLQLGAADGQTAKEIAHASMVTPSTLTGVVDTLERDGLIERRRSDTDRRVIRLHLTEAGRQRLSLSATKLSAEFDQLFDHVEPADEAAIRRFLLGAVDRFSAELGLPGTQLDVH
ncbi:MarR family transcriptional regulator [Micromonospora soli]|uniref:MarR family winged helix-turn-helix transcriptional regulator n=1 Tax=Micromonospora sp. NBRC 110009 TaxID=3061627 RepID=UPI0026728C66|nr:MarR family transcriptional regulator [Micromonospora sp. NBRC 110009]WKU00434.1 MarR family transcriptional regulator [Micromonospora sp. NBRC 110009]